MRVLPIAALLLTLLAAAAPALAHGGEDHPAWTFDPWIVAPLALAGGLYAAGTARLWRRAGIGRGIRPWRCAAYAAGWLSLALALCSPLHWLGERLFTAHMIEHEIVMAVAAPLLAAARPVGAFLWALPRALRALFVRCAHAAPVRAGWRWLTAPGMATVLHGAALWLWHAPALLDATVADTGVHRLQHLSFLGSALLFWWALFRRAHPGVAAGHLLVTMMHMGLLGALIALAPRVLYPAQTAEAPRWGLTPLEDQQLAGLVMWVPAGTVYLAAALAFAASWLGWRGGAPPLAHATPPAPAAGRAPPAGR